MDGGNEGHNSLEDKTDSFSRTMIYHPYQVDVAVPWLTKERSTENFVEFKYLLKCHRNL